jgi:hypothetical protein
MGRRLSLMRPTIPPGRKRAVNRRSTVVHRSTGHRLTAESVTSFVEKTQTFTRCGTIFVIGECAGWACGVGAGWQSWKQVESSGTVAPEARRIARRNSERAR